MFGIELYIVKHLGNGFAVNHLVDIVVILEHVDVHRIGVAKQVVQVTKDLLVGTYQKDAQIVVLTWLEFVNGQGVGDALV